MKRFMNTKYLFLLLAILGTVVPYYHFVSFLMEHGLDMPLFWVQMMGTPIAAFFSWDVLIASMALISFIWVESRRLNLKNWWVFILFNLLVGVSLALPAFLYYREVHLATAKQDR